jgi:hypothetical protein
MEVGLATEVPLCKYDPETQILMTPQDAIQDGILSNVQPLPFFQDILTEKQAANATKKGKKKEHTALDMCFQLGSAHSVQTVCGANDGKYTTVTTPGIDLGLATQASTAKPSNADQPVIKIASTDDDASSSEGSEGERKSLSSSDVSFAMVSLAEWFNGCLEFPRYCVETLIE